MGAQPELISKELPITWGQINMTAKQTIWIDIDSETREIRVGVPYGAGVTTPNLVLKCNYEESPSFAAPIHFSPYIGKEIATGNCYKWSIDTIAANLCLRAKRTLLNPPDMSGKYGEQTFAQSQVLYASANPDGVVAAVVPGFFSDQGYSPDNQRYAKVGIDSVYETVAPGELMRPAKLGGLQANLDGGGDTYFTFLAGVKKAAADGGMQPDNPFAEYPLAKTFNPINQKGKPGFSCGARGRNERFRVRVSNNKQPDNWFDVKYLAIMAQVDATAAPK
jgi:hypothetical protein